jgi:hypothetical protein
MKKKRKLVPILLFVDRTIEMGIIRRELIFTILRIISVLSDSILLAPNFSKRRAMEAKPGRTRNKK